MKIEICDLCGKKIDEYKHTKVIIKERNGKKYDVFGILVERKFKGVICDDCLKLLKDKKHKQIQQIPVRNEYFNESYVCPSCGQALKWR